MNAVIVEAVPTLPLGAFTVAGKIGLAQALVDNVMLARDVVNVEFDLTDDLISVVEFVRLGQMCDLAVWIMKAGRDFSVPSPCRSLRATCQRVRIGWLVEADMAVADLQEGKG